MNPFFYKALGNKVRLQIINCLGEKDKTVSELIRNCGVSQSAVSQHLSKLKDAGIVSCKKVGREMFYQLENKELSEISEKLINFTKE